MTDLLIDSNLFSLFQNAIVDKSLARSEIVSRLPRFVAEYLISDYSRKYPSDWRKILIDIIRNYYPEPAEKDKVLGKAKRYGIISLIDEYRVRVDLKRDMYFLNIPSLHIKDALVNDAVVEKYERIFTGVWGIGNLEYKSELLSSWSKLGSRRFLVTPLILEEFQPFQAYKININEFIEARRHLSTNEWMDLLVKSIGLNPKAYSMGQKLLLLFRLVPLVEGNVNLMELGPRATGKTYLYRNISYYTRIYAGGTISAATLFYHSRLKTLGDIATRDAVIFDEIAKVRFNNQYEIIPKLKDYMVDGHFERGILQRAHSTCSLIFAGNIDKVSTDPASDILDHLPEFLKEPALLDRIHGLIPGWKLPKIMKSNIHLATGPALAADYLSEILHRLRDYSLASEIDELIEIQGDYTIRDEKAIQKLIVGIIKLLYPHQEYNKEDLYPIVEKTIELRKYITHILAKLLPQEIKPLSVKIQVHI